jgi:cytochrome c-type biogenesis protein CcmH/NrfF
VTALRLLRLPRSLQLLLLACLIAVTANAGGLDTQARYDRLSHRIMCPCGCNELLGECNHVGCPDSDKMRGELLASIQHNDSDDTIFRGFQQEYGPTALAAPMFTAFNRMSWFVPPLLLLLGIAGVFALVRKWKPRAVPMPATPSTPGYDTLRDRIRRETDL